MKLSVLKRREIVTAARGPPVRRPQRKKKGVIFKPPLFSLNTSPPVLSLLSLFHGGSAPSVGLIRAGGYASCLRAPPSTSPALPPRPWEGRRFILLPLATVPSSPRPPLAAC